jgi:hypothetical protein
MQKDHDLIQGERRAGVTEVEENVARWSIISAMQDMLKMEQIIFAAMTDGGAQAIQSDRIAAIESAVNSLISRHTSTSGKD